MVKDPKPKPTWRSRALRMLRLIAIAYLCYALLALIMQQGLIFPGTGRPASVAPPSAAEVWTHASEQGDVFAWFIPGRGRTAETPGPAVMHFHGNGELIEDAFVVPIYRRLGISVLLVEYRGYGDSAGTPSARGILEDARAFRDRLADDLRVDGAQLIYHGRSLGGGFAAELARSHPPAALVLESTFTALGDMAHRMLLPGFLLRHRLSPKSVLPTLDAPVLIIHGDRDPIIPFSHGKRLAALARNTTFYDTSDGHNDLPIDLGAYERALASFLRAAKLAP